MKNFLLSLLCVVGITVHASQFTITPASFGPEQKALIELNFQIWNKAIQESGIAVGLAAIFDNLNSRNFESLFQDEVAIGHANAFLTVFNNDPVMRVLPELSKLGDYNINNAKQFSEQMLVALVVAKQADCLKNMINDIVTPSKDPSYLFNFYGSSRSQNVLQYRIDALKNNRDLPTTEYNQEVSLGMILVLPFLPVLSSLVNANN